MNKNWPLHCFLWLTWSYCLFSAQNSHQIYEKWNERQQQNPHYQKLLQLFPKEIEKILLINEGYCVPITYYSTLYELFPENKTALSNDRVIIHQCFQHSKTVGQYLSEYFFALTCAHKTGAHFLAPTLVDVNLESEEDFDLDPRHHHHHHHSSPPKTPAKEIDHPPYTRAMHELRMLFADHLPRYYIHPKPKSLSEQQELQERHCQCTSLVSCLQDENSAFRLEKELVVEVMQVMMDIFHSLITKYPETLVHDLYDEINLPVSLLHGFNASSSTTTTGGSKSKLRGIVVTEDTVTTPHSTATTTTTGPRNVLSDPVLSAIAMPDWLKSLDSSSLSHPWILPLVPDIAIYYQCNSDYDDFVNYAGILSFPSIGNQLESIIRHQLQSHQKKRKKRRLTFELTDHAPSSTSHHYEHHHHSHHNNHSVSSLSPTTAVKTTAGEAFHLKYIYLISDCGQRVPLPSGYHRYPSINSIYMRCSLITQWLYQYLNERVAALTTSTSGVPTKTRYVVVVKRNSNILVDFYRFIHTPVVISSMSSFSFFPLLLNQRSESEVYFPLLEKKIDQSVLAGFHRSFKAIENSKSLPAAEVLVKPNPWRLVYFTLLEKSLEVSELDAFVVQGKGKSVYLIKHGQKHAFNSGSDFEALGYEWGEVMRVDQGQLDRVPMGPVVTVD